MFNANFNDTFSTNRRVLFIFVIVIYCCSFNSSTASISPIAGLGHNQMAFGDWEDWLRLQRQFHEATPNFMDKIPNQVPKFSTAKNAAKRDEKRRDFEHGWEQCEFSPISCMLKRRRKR